MFALRGPRHYPVAALTPGVSLHPRATLAATILGSSVAFIDGSVINVALPALSHDLGASPAGLAWTIDAYLLPLGALTLLGGAAGDRFGRRRLFLLGLAIFTAASMLCAASPSVPWLLAGRGIQGLGAALLMPNSLAILGTGFSGEARGRAIGTWAAAGALAGAFGPLIGGWLVGTVGWRAIFLLNLPVAAGAVFLAWNYVAETRQAEQAGSLDWQGAAAVTTALGLLTWSLTAGSSGGGASRTILAAAFVGAGLAAAFVVLEVRRGDQALMPIAMFATRSFVGLTLLTFFHYGSLGGLLVLLPFFLISIEHWSAIAAGGAMVPIPMVIGLASPFMGRVTGRYGGRLPLAVGAALVATGMALYVRVGTAPVSYLADVLPATLLVALGLGASVAPLTTSVMGSVTSDHVGAASGFNSAVARVSGLIATALAGYVFALQGSTPAFVHAFRVAACVGAASSALAASCALFLLEPSIGGNTPGADTSASASRPAELG